MVSNLLMPYATNHYGTVHALGNEDYNPHFHS
jgi:hypothetical protein